MAKQDPESGTPKAAKPAKPAAKPVAAKAAKAAPAATSADPGASATAAATATAAASATAAANATVPKKHGVPVPVAGPDSFMDRVQPHIKKIAIGALALFLVIGVFVGMRWMKNRTSAKNTAKVNAALGIEKAPIVAAGQPAPPTADKTYPTEKDRALAALAELGQAGGAADKSALYEAALMMDAGKLDDADKVYKAHTGDAGLDGVLAREGVGYVAEARAAATKDAAEQEKQLQQALDAFKAMQPDDKGARRDYALYDQARILAQLGKRAEAKAALDAALVAAPRSEIKSDIEARLALLEGP